MNLLKYRLAQLVSSAQRAKPEYDLHRRVLMYHSINQSSNSASDSSSDTYSISEWNFAAHVDLLAEHCDSLNSKIVSLDSASKSGVTITFDDGYRDTLTVAAKILDAKKLPFTVFVTSQNITSGNSNYLSQSQLIELSKIPGVTIGSHGHSHTHLAELSSLEVHNELRQSKEWLEQTIQKTVTTLSYPHGSFNAEVVRLAADTGYKFAATSKWGVYQVGTRPLEIPRIDVWGPDTKRTLQQKLCGKWNWMAGFI